MFSHFESYITRCINPEPVSSIRTGLFNQHRFLQASPVTELFVDHKSSSLDTAPTGNGFKECSAVQNNWTSLSADRFLVLPWQVSVLTNGGQRSDLPDDCSSSFPSSGQSKGGNERRFSLVAFVSRFRIRLRCSNKSNLVSLGLITRGDALSAFRYIH